MSGGLGPGVLQLDTLDDPTDRYELGALLGSGVCGEVYMAVDSQEGNKRVAVKIQKVSKESMEDINEEYRILRDLSSHPNLPDFYGVFLKKDDSGGKLWMIMELCEGGPVTDLIRGLQRKNRKMCEDHIAFILKEILKALMFLHENHVMHRDVRGSNILLTKEGEVKLVDFGLSRELKSTHDRRHTCVGSPSWMAPEVVMSGRTECDETTSYDNRIDVWALGITAIELGDGKAPFEDIHPTRALFQIVRNPPPGLYRPANWTQVYNDFITECLEKNPEHRPYLSELMEHPFLTALPENDFHLSTELKSLLQSVSTMNVFLERKPEVRIRTGFLKEKDSPVLQPMHVEDLAALEKITEDSILSELQERLKTGSSYTFVGDILIFLNPNEEKDIYNIKYHVKYQFKSRSDNEPHIFSVADSAYQDVLHHEEPQHILLAGETLSGKTTNFKHLLRHLLFLGMSPSKIGDKVEKAVNIIHAFGNAATPLNADSTRHVLYTQITLSTTGKVTGAIFWLYQLEKWRVTYNKAPAHANFHIFYYFYDALEADGELDKFNLESGRHYQYLRTEEEERCSPKPPSSVREDPVGNIEKFKQIQQQLTDLEFDENQQVTLWKTLAAILLLGEIEFQDQEDGKADIVNTDIVNKAAELLGLDGKKFCWALCNYCVIQKGTAVRRKHTKSEARVAKDVLASGMYTRLVDWVVNVINLKLSFSRAVFGDKFFVSILDMFGFECYQNNGLEQLFVNTLNEEIQYHFNQKVFAWEMKEQEEEEIPLQTLQYYDNKPTVDELMSKPEGLLYIIDEASRTANGPQYIIESLTNNPKGPRIRMSTNKDFSVAHYTGKVTYTTLNIPSKNRDFLPPEMIETIRLSTDMVIKQLFTNQLSRSGNLTLTSDQNIVVTSGKKKRWGAALVAENQRARKYNTESRGEYSQTRRMRTAGAMFRATSLEVLRNIAAGPGFGGTHFVRCVRADLGGHPNGFQAEIVRQQLRALAVTDTAKSRQKGYSHRVTFPDFIRRYKFLAFDFNENVEETKENCRLLLIRLKMEGWVIGKSKVFLRYYNEEYLSRLYELQVKKIIKVQSMLRAFLAKRTMASKLKFRQDSLAKESVKPPKQTIPRDKKVQGKIIRGKGFQEKKPEDKRNEFEKDKNENPKNPKVLSQDEAATIIQKKYRGYQVRKQYGPIINSSSGKLDNETAMFMKQYCKRWRAKTVFQVLLLYRAARHQDLVYFSQQAHLYNQNSVSALHGHRSEHVSLSNLDIEIQASAFIGDVKTAVWKLPFRLNDLSYSDSTYLCDQIAAKRACNNDDSTWDEPFNRSSTNTLRRGPYGYFQRDKGIQTGGNINIPMATPSYMGKKYDLNFTQKTYCRHPTKASQTYKDIPPRAEDPTELPRVNSRYKPMAPQVPVTPMLNRPITVLKPSYGSNYDYGKTNYGYQKPELNNYGQHMSSNEEARKEKYKPPGPMRQHNPIVEMEMKARMRNNNSNETSDEPPFNFQAMLRKTNYIRKSLRRGTNRNGTDPENINSFGNEGLSLANQPNGECSNQNSVLYNGSVRQRGHPRPLQRQDSGDCRKMLTQQHRVSRESRKFSRLDEGSMATELAPGITIHGQITDL